MKNADTALFIAEAKKSGEQEAARLRIELRDWQDSSELYRLDCERMRGAILGAIEAIERGSTGAPVLECLKAAISAAQETDRG